MKLIGAAIVVIIIIAVGALVLTGSSKSKSSNTPTSVVPTTTGSGAYPTTVASGSGSGSTAPTTTAQSSGSSGSIGSFQDWSGQNLTLAQFSADNFTYTKATQLNATYDYKSEVSFTGTYNFSENSTGTTVVQKYYNSSRIDTTTNTSFGSFASTQIYNASSHTGYICTTGLTNNSVQCMVSAAESIVNSTGILGSEGSNVTLSGYYNDIKVTTTTYNGQPCTLVTGNLYLKAVTKTSPVATSVIQGTSSACTSTQYNARLNQSLVGTITITSNGNTTNANLAYTESEIHISNSASAAITALPGPVVSS